MNDIIGKLAKHLRLSLASSSWEKKTVWLTSDHPGEIAWERGLLKLNKLNLCFRPQDHEFILDGYERLVQLNRYGGTTFSFNDDTLIAQTENMRIEVHTMEELYILREVLLCDTYQIGSTKELVVVDIGMNVGITSLHLATRDDILHVYGFEPFKPTYSQCLKNISLNPHLSAKITTHNIGLSDRAQDLTVDYDPSNRGQAGIHGVAHIKTLHQEPKKETISLSSALDRIDDIHSRHPDKDILCKIDCEGSEYDIFRGFGIHGIPEYVKAVAIEWHREGAGPLVDVLAKNGFKTASTSNFYNSAGMIYGFR